MEENKATTNKKTFSPDWLLKGVLTKIGDTFDRLTGRNWKPSSSLATSELIEKIKLLLDQEVKDFGVKGKFVPHNIKLKMQWDKFSTDSENSIEILQKELHIAAIDHINDKRYYTYHPINIEIKPDYFTEGVKLLASFETFDENEAEAAVNVTIPVLKVDENIPPSEIKIEMEKEIYVVSFLVRGKQKEIELGFAPGDRKSVGRTKENDLTIDETSVSKVQAALVLNSQNKLMVADTGSTNGTFINGQRIAYGRSFPVSDGDILKFGLVEVAVKHIPVEVEEPELIVEDEKVLQTDAIELMNNPDQDEQFDLKTNQVLPETESDTAGYVTNKDYSDSLNYKTSEDFTDSRDNSDLSFVETALSDSMDFEVPEIIEPEKEPKVSEEINETNQGIILDFGDKK